MLPNQINVNELMLSVNEKYYDIYKERLPIYKLKTICMLIFETIKDNICKGNKIKVRNFGTFDAYLYSERRRVDPVLNKEHFIPARLIPNLHSSNKFRRDLSNNVILLEEVMEKKKMLKELLSDDQGILSSMRLYVLIVVIMASIFGLYACLNNSTIAKDTSIGFLSIGLLGKAFQKTAEKKTNN